MKQMILRRWKELTAAAFILIVLESCPGGPSIPPAPTPDLNNSVYPTMQSRINEMQTEVAAP